LQGRSLAVLQTLPLEQTGQAVTPTQVETLRKETLRPGQPHVKPTLG
jgi:hypothetical protein